jgi:tRNA dimethylallyltransferase
MNKYLISIVGPTAIGKTKLSILLAKHYSTEIVSADSRQFYKELSIGTAKPTKSELNSVKHHLIGNKSVIEPYTIGEFEKDAINKISEIHKSNRFAILVGGSGLYQDVIKYGLNKIPKVDIKVRDNLNKEYNANGLINLQNKLKELDVLSYNSIDIKNPRRVIRALEVCITSKKPYSSFLNKKFKKRNFKIIELGIIADRSLIYKNIDERVDLMIKKGLVDECKNVKKYSHLNSLNTIGYKEIFKYFNNEISLDIAVKEIKKNTRRFAKRQMTWYNNNNQIKWFDQKYSIKNVIKMTESLVNN